MTDVSSPTDDPVTPMTSPRNLAYLGEAVDVYRLLVQEYGVEVTTALGCELGSAKLIFFIIGRLALHYPILCRHWNRDIF